ncbi:unnamed protein product [Phaedon cochleariae]|uniref:Structure-specific endonuclease subunit SLX4 n=1 Tax=Phaedon cochleariae TaxID=80249 RepID=A0A9N9SCR1_PHACE|nr:unnamed protein product [Phaedon cochleariae]
MKKNQLNNHGSVKHSFHNLMSNPKASSSTSTRNNVSEQSDYFESPYKGSLGEIKCISLGNDSDDFRTLKNPVRKVPKVSQKEPVTSATIKRKTTSTKKTRSGSIQKSTKDNFKNLDVNSEHLQMAIALSNSTLALEYPERFRKNKEPDFPTFLSPEKIPKHGTILERYGFKSSKTKDSAFQMAFVEEPKKRKNYSKFRFITPVLHTRTEEDRQSLINTKVSMIISQQRCSTFECTHTLPETLHSFVLQSYHSQGRQIFNVDLENYYCSSLGLPSSKSVYGCLLKNWDEIPGRDRTPGKHTKNLDHNKEYSEGKSNKLSTLEGNVPSDSKTTSSTIPDMKLGLDSSVYNNINKDVSTLISTDSGIEYSDGFCQYSQDPSHVLEDTKEICQENQGEGELVDLTQSSNSNETNLYQITNVENYPGLDHFQIPDFSVNASEISSSKNLNTGESLPKLSDSSIQNLTQKSQYFENKMEVCMENILDEESDKSNKSPLPSHYCQDLSTSINKSDVVSDEKIDSPNSMLSGVSGITDAEDHQNNEIEIMKENSIIFEKPNRTSLYSGDSNHSRKSSEMYDYNCTNSLNVTDYVTQMLNSQVDQSEVQENHENEDDSLSQVSSSQTSIIISDEELNYSSFHSAEQRNKDFYNLDNPDTNLVDEADFSYGNISSIHKGLKEKYLSKLSETGRKENKLELPMTEEAEPIEETTDILTNDVGNKSRKSKRSRRKKGGSTNSSPAKLNQSKNVSTPDNNMIIKTQNVTPMADYDQMDTPKIRKELDKFGFKPLRKPKGIKLLKYIYESTHPVVRSEESSTSDRDDEEKACKKPRTISPSGSVPVELGIFPTELVISHFFSDNPKDFIFGKCKASSKIPTCQIPLQVAWYNFVSSNPQLHNNILLYEPLHLEVIHSMLNEQSGCTFHLKDLVTFLDKKCITFRTAQTISSKRKDQKAKRTQKGEKACISDVC